MGYYRQHLFFCVNQRDAGKQCCNNAGASHLRDYAKKRLDELKLTGQSAVRANQSGCLGRCSEGPTLVVYPEGVWYTYANTADIDEIIDEHIIHGRIVTRLLMAPARSDHV